MRSFIVQFCAKLAVLCLVIGSGPGDAAAAGSPGACEGTSFPGAWFTALNPSGMEVSVSRESANENGILSVWLRSEDGKAEFFLFSPQWGGTPYEIFLGAKSKNEIIVIESQSLKIVQLELVYDDLVGRYSITESSDPASHLTVGYRTQDGTLNEEFLQKYKCFMDSIVQYSD